MALELKFIIRYTGGTADNSLLDLYDAGVSTHGLAKALAITCHALVSKGHVRRQGDSIPNVKFYLQPPRNGSFIETITIVFDNPAVQAIGSSVLASAFWDFLKFTWKQATGTNSVVTEFQVKKILDDNEFLEEEIIEALEAPLQQLHRPIKHDRSIKIEINRPRIGNILTMDQETLDYVTSQHDPEERENIIGNVTKYNILSGIGRFYDNDLGKTVSFYCSNELSDAEKNTITWSLHNSNKIHGTGKIILTVDEIKSSRGHLKRYIIKNAERYSNPRQRAS